MELGFEKTAAALTPPMRQSAVESAQAVAVNSLSPGERGGVREGEINDANTSFKMARCAVGLLPNEDIYEARKPHPPSPWPSPPKLGLPLGRGEMVGSAGTQGWQLALRQPHQSGTGVPRSDGGDTRHPRTFEGSKAGNIFSIRRTAFGIGLLVPLLLLTGCLGRQAPLEKRARQQVAIIQPQYRPGDAKPALPSLTTNAALADFLLFAVLNQPRIEAAYYDWVAAVERITVERSLPDPRLTFESDISNMLMSLMPGLMVDIPGPGKIRARVGVASAESDAKYYAFEAAMLDATYALKKAYYQMQFLNERIHVTRETLKLLDDLLELARAQQQFGKVTLQDVLRAEIELEKMRVELANLEDSRAPLAAQVKAALGLKTGDPDPPLPLRFEAGPAIEPDKLLAEALERNPRLKLMAAEVKFAAAAIVMARKGKVPDFSLGLEANAYGTPTVFTPQAGVTLPIWKDKIAADIAASQAGRRAAEARLSAEQIQLAVEVADKLFMLRESARNADLLAKQLLPKAKMSFEVGRANYQAGKIDYINLADAQRTWLMFQLDEIAARAQRELALAELTSLILGRLPEQSPRLEK